MMNERIEVMTRKLRFQNKPAWLRFIPVWLMPFYLYLKFPYNEPGIGNAVIIGPFPTARHAHAFSYALAMFWKFKFQIVRFVRGTHAQNPREWL
jgi:hypothetical protein